MTNIIIPAYNAHSTIRQTIASVAMQDNLRDILLTIVDDCSDERYDYLQKDYPYVNIEILRKEKNTGCGQSRQYGIDSCKCDYFMFLDADDCLYAPNVVKQLSEYIDSNNFDYVISSFVSETEDGKYVLYKNNTVWMHGKIFRTSFIQSENIRYSHTRLNEDHSFNAIVIDNPRSKGTFVDLVSYVWKYNKNSLVRSESFESYTNKEYVKNAIYTLSEFISRGYDKEKTKAILLKYLISFYAYFLKDLESGKDADILDTYLNDVRGFWSSIPESYKDICINDFQQFFYHDETIRDLIRRDYIFEITFSDFLKEAFNFNLLK